MKLTKFKHQGIGLIEVLVALVVVSLGLLALASLQGELMSSSGQSKAQSEAVAIAEQKIEALRNNIQESDYNSIGSSLADETINGTNEVFTLSWTTVPNTEPGRKTITANVTWENGAVALSTDISWMDPEKSIDYAEESSGTNALSPSPNNESSFETDLRVDELTNPPVSLGDGSNLSTIEENGDIYLIDPATGYALIRFTGGIMHTIKGTVYVEGEESNVYPVAFSDLGYCIFPVEGTTSDYICYFGGDCSQGGDSGQCSGSYADINGGWYGKIGLHETSSDNFQNKKVCFGEDVYGTGSETVTTTARSYSTVRVDGANNAIDSEGINASFSCHNFLVVNKSGNSYPCASIADAYSINIASSSIERVLGYQSGVEELNIALVERGTLCGTLASYTVTGNITGDSAEDVIILFGKNSCPISVTAGVYTYSCTISTSTGVPDLMAYNGGVLPSIVTGADLATAGLIYHFVTGNVTLPETSYVITGNLLGDQAGTVTVFLPDGTPCNIEGSSPYTCSITTTAASIVLTAVNSTTGGSISPPESTVVLSGISAIVGPDFTGASVAVETTYTITGALLGSNQNKITVAISDGGTCARNKVVNVYSYECTVSTASDSVVLTATTTQNGAVITPSSIPVTNIISNGPSIVSEAFTSN